MSSGPLDSQAVRNALQTLRGYLSDLVGATPADATTIVTRFQVFQTKLRLLVNYMEQDDHIRWISEPLHRAIGRRKDWFTEVAAGADPTLPEGAGSLLSHRYLCLVEIKKTHIDMRTFVSTLFGGRGDYTEAFRAFRAEYIDGLSEGLLAYLGGIEARIGSADRIVLDQAASEVLAAMDAAPKKASAPKKKASSGRKAAKKPAKKKPGKAATKAAKASGGKKKAAKKKAAKKRR